MQILSQHIFFAPFCPQNSPQWQTKCTQNHPSFFPFTGCPLLFWLCLVVVGVLGHDKDSSAETIFSEETIAISNTFDCTGKPDGKNIQKTPPQFLMFFL